MSPSNAVTAAFLIRLIGVVAVLFGVLLRSPARRRLAVYGLFLVAVVPYVKFVLDVDRLSTMAPIVGLSLLLAIAPWGQVFHHHIAYPLCIFLAPCR